jgi:hypothetical protein
MRIGKYDEFGAVGEHGRRREGRHLRRPAGEERRRHQVGLTFCSQDTFLRLLARLRHPKASRLCFAAAFTPRGFDFYYDTFVGKNKTDEIDLVRAAPFENTHVPAGYYETLARSYDKRFYQQEVLGEFLSLQDRSAYYAFDRSRNLDDSLAYDPACRLSLGSRFQHQSDVLSNRADPTHTEGRQPLQDARSD